jgi:hypothetical protein
VGDDARSPGRWQGLDPRLAITLVDDDNRDVGACMVGKHVDSCEAVATTSRKRCMSQWRHQGGRG